MPSAEKPALPRKNPCASCPYRKNVPSGVWDESEYQKLPAYDGDIPEQSSLNVFMCHQQDGCACSGWLGHREYPTDMLAVRLGLRNGSLDDSCANYTTEVELFGSGQEAADHGRAEIHSPGSDAQKVITKIVKNPHRKATP